MHSNKDSSCLPTRLCLCITAIACLWSPVIGAAPFLPERHTQVLERLPTSQDRFARELSRLRKALTKDPDNLRVAVSLAERYLAIGRAGADPRYAGYAQAALGPWWDHPDPPPQVLLLRASLRQRSHDFDSALADLSRVLALQPRNPQAWLTQAVILQVRGDYKKALRSCLVLSRLSRGLAATVCTAGVSSLAGQAEQSYQLLLDALSANPAASVQERLWALTVLAEIAIRLGRDGDAESHFEQALALRVRDVYLLSAFSDFLIDQARPHEARELLKDDIRPDALLLRLTLAEQRLNSPQLEGHVESLKARFAASRLRGNSLHLRSEARFTLYLLNKPAEALQLAQKNWALQREPADNRLVLEAALAAGDPEAAEPVLNWLRRVGQEDARVSALTKHLVERKP